MAKEKTALDALEYIHESAQNEKPVKPLYDAGANQRIPLTISKGGNNYDVAIELSPISDDEWFQLTDDILAGAKRLKNVSVDLFEPYAILGRGKATARHGYKARDDWRTATRDADYISALKSYLDIAANSEPIETAELLDDDSDTAIKLLSNFNGRECETTIGFREETKAQMDEYLAALSGQPNKGVLASSKKISKERRLYALYEDLTTGSEDYAARIPAWHCVEAVSAFLNLQLSRLGKF